MHYIAGSELTISKIRIGNRLYETTNDFNIFEISEDGVMTLKFSKSDLHCVLDLAFLKVVRVEILLQDQFSRIFSTVGVDPRVFDTVGG